MHLAYRRRVVVDESETRFTIRRTDDDLFIDFARHALAIRMLGGPVIARIDVAADANRAQRSQPLLAGALAARVVEDLILKLQDDIRDQLLATRIILGIGTRHEREM